MSVWMIDDDGMPCRITFGTLIIDPEATLTTTATTSETIWIVQGRPDFEPTRREDCRQVWGKANRRKTKWRKR